MHILIDFYNGLIHPCEDVGNPKTKEFKELVEKISKLETDYLSTISENEQKVYEEIKQIQMNMHWLEQENLFAYAFKLGFQFAKDILNE